MATKLDSSPASASPSRSERAARAKPSAFHAVRRVSQYLRALGLSDRDRVRELSHRIVLGVSANDPAEHAARAVEEAQVRFEAWREALCAALPEGVDPLWLRAFIAARPELFLGDVERAQRAAWHFGEPALGIGPKRVRFRPQVFEPARLPRWLLGLAPPLLLAALAASALWHAITLHGWTWLDLGWVGLFAFLFAQAAIGLSTAALGFLTRGLPAPSTPPSAAAPAAAAPATAVEPGAAPSARTALLMPIYHEDAEDVFATLAGMREALAALPEGADFEIFALSDSRDPEVCADEERAFRLVAAVPSSVPIYYHRRAHNERQKVGNLAEFFERWGHRYQYAVTLDADSIMSAETLRELVRRMDQNPKVALIQTPLALYGGTTLFARALAFSASVCGPSFARGLSIWSGSAGNYYGHNAILRVSAFLDCCALPKLNGERPFGGEVLSHDFVEAALLRRAGWQVRLAHDLGTGSYERLPPTLVEYVARDQRWCQGNLQHLLIARMRGLHPMSRIHLLMGAFAYLAAPAWLCFMVCGVLLWRQTGAAFQGVAAVVGVATLCLLLGPWLLGLLDTLSDERRRRAHGGPLRLTASALLGVLLGSVLAPVLMLHHTRIVLSILMGRAVSWAPQNRQASSQLSRIVRVELPATLLGALVVVASCLDPAGLLLWLSPLCIPWLLAIPIDLSVSSTSLGQWLRRAGVFEVPVEREPERILSRIEELRSITRGDASVRFRELVLDPVLLAAHLAKLGGQTPSASAKQLAQLRKRALEQGPAALSALEWRALAEDGHSLQLLHTQAWQQWPVESWDLGHEQRREPPDTLPVANVQALRQSTARGTG